VLLAWSSGKDAAYSLHVLRARGVEIVGLLTTINAPTERVAMHDVRRELVRRQAEAVGLPLVEVGLPWPCPNEAYEAAMAAALADARARGATASPSATSSSRTCGATARSEWPGPASARCSRSGVGRRASWRGDARRGTEGRAHDRRPPGLPPELAGRTFDESLLRRLPEGVDPCGENGEFHTFAWDGPAFRHPVSVEVGTVVERDGFAYADLLPAT